MKIRCLILCLILILGGIFSCQGNIYADTQRQVKVINNCILYTNPKINYAEDETKIVLNLSFGEILTINGEEEGESGFAFYHVSITKNDIEYSGYVISNFVTNIENSALKKTLDPNAKTLNQAQIYFSKDENNKLILNGREVVLERYEEIKIIDGYDKSKAFHKIMFEKNGEIYTGYIKTTDLLVEGFNATLISVIFIFVLVGATALSIYAATIKKRKKLARIKNRM